MKKVKKTLPGNFYIFTSRSAANSNYIESISEAKQLFIYANLFLKGYLKIYDYVITRHGIQMLVRIEKYSRLKELTDIDYTESTIWLCISDRMRLFLSHYVKKINRLRGRTGVLVHSNFEKEEFETLLEAKECMHKLRNQVFTYYQRSLKYRGLKSHYKIPKKLGKGSIFLCSRELGKVVQRFKGKEKTQLFGDIQKLVGSKSMKLLINNRNSLISTPNSP